MGREGRGIPKTSVSRFKFQDGSGVWWEGRGGEEVIVLIVATDSRLWFKFQVSNLKAHDFTPVCRCSYEVHAVTKVRFVRWEQRHWQPASSEGKQVGQARMDAQYCSRPVFFDFLVFRGWSCLCC